MKNESKNSKFGFSISDVTEKIMEANSIDRISVSDYDSTLVVTFIDGKIEKIKGQKQVRDYMKRLTKK